MCEICGELNIKRFLPQMLTQTTVWLLAIVLRVTTSIYHTYNYHTYYCPVYYMLFLLCTYSMTLSVNDKPPEWLTQRTTSTIPLFCNHKASSYLVLCTRNNLYICTCTIHLNSTCRCSKIYQLLQLSSSGRELLLCTSMVYPIFSSHTDVAWSKHPVIPVYQ